MKKFLRFSSLFAREGFSPKQFPGTGQARRSRRAAQSGTVTFSVQKKKRVTKRHNIFTLFFFLDASRINHDSPLIAQTRPLIIAAYNRLGRISSVQLHLNFESWSKFLPLAVKSTGF